MCSVTVETGQLCFDLDGYFVLSLKGTSYANRTEYAEHIAVSAVQGIIQVLLSYDAPILHQTRVSVSRYVSDTSIHRYSSDTVSEKYQKIMAEK